MVRPAGDARQGSPDLVLTPQPPYSWQQTLAALEGWSAVPDRGEPDGDGGWRLPLRLGQGSDARVVVARLTANAGEGPFAPDLEVRLEGGAELTLGEAADAWEELDRFLALSLDLAPLVDTAADDPAFAPVERALHGFHPPRFRSAFQAACWCVVRQRTPQRFAAATMQRLLVSLGERAPHGAALGSEPERAGKAGPGENSPLALFPTPQALAHDARAQLVAATNNLRKVERLEGLAREFVGVDEAELRVADYDEARRWLGSLPGLGPWSAEQVLWRGLGRVERAPWRDTGALSAVSAVYAPGLMLVTGAARELARYYSDLQGVWMSYLKAYLVRGRGR